jgi:hypothetical protein
VGKKLFEGVGLIPFFAFLEKKSPFFIFFLEPVPKPLNK